MNNSTTEHDTDTATGIERKPNCDMPDCVGVPGDEKHAVRDPEGEVLEMCDGCLNDGWRAVVEVLD
jgi:hypothetical protein